MLHQFSPAEPTGKRTCPKCNAMITGATSTGKCSELQIRKNSTSGVNTNCDHVFTKKMTKDKKKILDLETQLAACGGGGGGSASTHATAQINRLQTEVTRLENTNVQLMTENNRLRQEALDSANFLESLDSELNEPLSHKGGAPPSLGHRGNSLTDSPPSLGHRGNSDGSSSLEDGKWDAIQHLLDAPLPDSELHQFKQENAQLKEQLAGVRQTLQQLLGKIN